MFLCLTSIGYAQRSGMIQRNANGMSQVRMDAQRDAQAYVNQFLWGADSLRAGIGIYNTYENPMCFLTQDEAENHRYSAT